MKRTPRVQSVTDRLAALCDATRLRLLRVLEREELSVGELSSVVQLPQSTVSRHLKLLSEHGWLVHRSEGTSTFYRLLMDDLPEDSRPIWAVVRDQLGDGADLADDLRRLQGVLLERRTDTRSFFGRVAGEWDGVRNELFGEKVTLKALLPLLPSHWTVADLGCGTGNAAELLAPCVSRVLCVDQSQPMLDAASKRLEQFRNVEFLVGDLERLPIADGSVDAAVCVLVLVHIADPQAAVREMARILKPGGIALIVDMTEHDRDTFKRTMGHRWQGFGVPELFRFMRSAGLTNERFQTLTSESEARGPGLFACTATKPVPSAGARTTLSEHVL